MTRRNALISALVLALAGAGAIALVHRHGPAEHDHGQHGNPELVLNDGKRWATDAALQKGMERIRDAVAPIVSATAARPPSKDEATALSGAIKDQVQYLVENCKLEPKADAALHVLLNDFLQGADALVADPTSRPALERIVKALDLYPHYFDHEGWQPLGPQ